MHEQHQQHGPSTPAVHLRTSADLNGCNHNNKRIGFLDPEKPVVGMTTVLKTVLYVSAMYHFESCRTLPTSTTYPLWPAPTDELAAWHPCFHWPISCTEQIYALNSADTTLTATSVPMVPPLESTALPNFLSTSCNPQSAPPNQPSGAAAMTTPELVTQEDTAVFYDDAGHPVITHDPVNTTTTPSTAWSSSPPPAMDHLGMLTRDQLIDRVLQLEYERRHYWSSSQGTTDAMHSPAISAPETYHQCRWSTCRAWAKQLEDLIQHVREVHVGCNKKAYYCEWDGCTRKDKPFFKRHKMHNHIRTHTGEKPFLCKFTDCNRSFSRLDSLKMHLKTHSNIKPFKCSMFGCNKAYFHVRSLRKHLKVHSTITPQAEPMMNAIAYH